MPPVLVAVVTRNVGGYNHAFFLEGALGLGCNFLKAKGGHRRQLVECVCDAHHRDVLGPPSRRCGRFHSLHGLLTAERLNGSNGFFEVSYLDVGKEVDQWLQVSTVSRLQGIEVEFAMLFVPNHQD